MCLNPSWMLLQDPCLHNHIIKDLEESDDNDLRNEKEDSLCWENCLVASLGKFSRGKKKKKF